MRVLVTGATGFVGGWLTGALRSAGHEPVGAPAQRELDVTDRAAVRRLIRTVAPDGVAHLAAVSFGPDARLDPARAMAVNEGGTRAVLEAIGAERPGIPVLITSSAEVYGAPAPEDLPLNESAPLRTVQPYGLSKVAQERVALELGGAGRARVIIARAFNHTGPGQRAEFVAPALARRALAARRSSSDRITVGNIDVRRDFLDVRDVVRAYVLLLERAAEEGFAQGVVVNVASGQAVAIREILELICSAAGVTAKPEVDPTLVRVDDPPLVVGDAGLLRALTGWNPRIDLRRTLRDLVGSLDPTVEP